MGLSGIGAEQYAKLCAWLLPPNDVLDVSEGSRLYNLLLGISDEFARVHAHAVNVLEEGDPRRTLDLLPHWEEVAGLPGDCDDPPETIQDRRLALHAKLTATGGQTTTYYIAVALAAGFDVEIEECSPFRVGASHAGDPLYDEDWAYVWIVDAEAEVTRFRAGRSAAGEPLATWPDGELECILNKIKPSHTIILYEYTEV